MTGVLIGVLITVLIIIPLVVLVVFLSDNGSTGGSRYDNTTRINKPSRRVSLFAPEYERVGVRGEILASKIIQSVLQYGDHLLTNVRVEFEGKEAELDNVVVNQYGVFIIEVKNYVGQIVGDEDDYEWIKYKMTDAGNVYEKTVKNPIKQVKRQIYILARYLEESELRVWIRGYAILLQGNSPVKSEYMLSNKADIERVIHTADRKMIDVDTVQRISDLLSLLSEN